MFEVFAAVLDYCSWWYGFLFFVASSLLFLRLFLLLLLFSAAASVSAATISGGHISLPLHDCISLIISRVSNVECLIVVRGCILPCRAVLYCTVLYCVVVVIVLYLIGGLRKYEGWTQQEQGVSCFEKILRLIDVAWSSVLRGVVATVTARGVGILTLTSFVLLLLLYLVLLVVRM